MRMTADIQEPIRCTVTGCSCACFRPGSVQLRSCDCCGHGWVAHALVKLQAHPPSICGPVEVALPGLVFDLSSLVLYGAQAVPVRLKILLDRLYSVLTSEQVVRILQSLGWSLGDYVRGYMLQYPGGKVLDRWSTVTSEEEQLVFRQFLRFGETRSIVELMTFQGHEASDAELKPAPKIRKVVPGRSKSSPEGLWPASDINGIHHFEKLASGLSALLPFHFPCSAFQRLVSPTKELLPSSKIMTILQKPCKTKLDEILKPEGEVGEDNDQYEAETASMIKTDPDKLSPNHSPWHQSPQLLHQNPQPLRQDPKPLHQNPQPLRQEPQLLHQVPQPLHQDPKSLHQSPKPLHHDPQPLHQEQEFHLQKETPLTHLTPLPSFSSFFLPPLRTSSLSSPLHPLPSTLCSLPPPAPAGGRKGRVCCGVCGKSFYDKGTLKIHYNAVHLKIKHRCTVAGCSMVFSSLRSRNRHSANPNPRLHTSTARDVLHLHRNLRHVATHVRQLKQSSESIYNALVSRRAETKPRNDVSSHKDLHCGRQRDTSPHLPPPPSHLLPAQTTAPSPGPAPIAIVNCDGCSASCDFGVVDQHQSMHLLEPTPKKKPRKSSTPVKIERCEDED